MAHQIKVERREGAGRGASRRLRHAGKVPAIVYGGGPDPVSIQLSHNEVLLAQENEWFYSSILDLNLDGDVQPVLLRDIQRHPAKARILHLDFQRVMADETIRVSVPLRFINQENSPAGKTSGVVIMHEMTEVEIECLPGDLPANIEVDLSDLKEGDVRHLSTVELPKGVVIPGLSHDMEFDAAIVIARKMAEEPEPEEVDEDAEDAEEQSAEVPAIKSKTPDDN